MIFCLQSFAIDLLMIIKVNYMRFRFASLVICYCFLIMISVFSFSLFSNKKNPLRYEADF